MRLPVSFAIGVRYALGGRSTLSTVSVVAVVGLALSVSVLVIVVSVINGAEREFKDRVLAVVPHVSIYGRSPLADLPDLDQAVESHANVQRAIPFVQSAGLLASNGNVQAALLTGIEPADSVLREFSPDGGFDRLSDRSFSLVIGARLARWLEVSIGDSVMVVLPSATITPAGLFPRQRRFEVVGILDTRSQLDQQAAYMHIGTAQRLHRLGDRVHGVQLELEDVFDLGRVADLATRFVGKDLVTVRTWQGAYGNLYQSIVTLKLTMFVLLSFLVGVAAFNLVSGLVMVVDQRRADIAILRSLGSDADTLVVSFLALGFVLGTVGIGAGIAAGVALASLLPHLFAFASNAFELELMSQYFITYLPVEIRLGDLVGIVVSAMLLCFVAALYPAWRATRLRPAQVLAYE